MKKTKTQKIKLLFLAVCAFFLIFIPAAPASGTGKDTAVSPPSVKATYACLIDGANGRLLYGKNPYEQSAMASTTKIMTLLLALEYGNLSDKVSVSANAAAQPKVKLGMTKGETYYLKDLLYSLMLESHNDTAVAIAEHIGGSVEGFAEMMNEKASALHLHNTNFVTPNGLDSPEHYSTAYDMALLGAYAIKNEDFLAIIQTPSHSFQTCDGKRSFTVTNKDLFLSMMDGALGIKTGFTNNAGYCFVGALERDGKTFVSVVLGCGWPPNKTWKWSDTKALMEYGLNSFHYINAPSASFYEQFPKMEIDGVQAPYLTLPVTDGTKAETRLTFSGSETLLAGNHDTIDYYIDCPDRLKAPVKKGETVGYVYVLLNQVHYTTIPIRASETVEMYTFSTALKSVLEKLVSITS